MTSRIEQMTRDLHLGASAADAALGAYGRKVQLGGGRNEAEQKLLLKTRVLFEHIEAMGGVDPATFLNCHPWQIHSGGPHLQGIIIPECPVDQPYLQYVQRDVRIDRADEEGGFVPSIVWPIMLMRDVKQQHEHWGGMVVYMGEVRLGDVKRTESKMEAILGRLLERAQDDESKELVTQLQTQLNTADRRYASAADVRKLLNEAEAKQIAHYRKRCDYVGEQWATDKGIAFRQITVQDRLMARWLHAKGIRPTLPKWVVEERPDNYKAKLCGKCGADVDPKGFACAKCNYIHDGIKAYTAGEISADNIALARHTREELDSVGLTEVRTLEEQRKVPVKTATKKTKDKDTE